MQDISQKEANYSDRMNGLARLGKFFDEGMIDKSLAGKISILSFFCLFIFFFDELMFKFIISFIRRQRNVHISRFCCRRSEWC